MTMDCEYIRQYYGVPATVGMRVTVYGKPGIIVADRGNYIGVNFDDDRPGIICNAHPTDHVEYGKMGKIRHMTRSQVRYQRYLEYGDGFDTFIDFCRWDSQHKH